jgi:predicted O-methyltransferase YrrM
VTPDKLPPWGKILPNQHFNSDQYTGSEPVEKALYDTILRVCGIPAPAQRFKLETTSMFTIEHMASSPVSLGIMQWLIVALGAKRVLEIGTFIGVSALYFAEALPTDGEVVTLEKFDHFAEIARKNFALNGFDKKIELKLGDAHDVLPTLARDKLFDLVFIDGNKERYADYFHMTEPLVRKGGVIVVDDSFFHGDAVNAVPQGDKGKGVRAMLDVAEGLSNWPRILLPVSNGMLLLCKPN